MYKLNQIKLNIFNDENDLKKKISKSIGVSVNDIDWSTLVILHKAIDARDKKNILFVYNVAFDFKRECAGDSFNSKKIKNAKNKLEKYEPIVFNPIILGSQSSPLREMGSQSSIIRDASNSSLIKDNSLKSDDKRPIVVGFGPAGIFASYILALNGLKPIVVERGKSLDERSKDVNKFFETMELDEESNVCFGEGGAGAFSDGKLNTNNKDKTGVYKFVLETFVKFGADKKILYENLPHIGTDKLVDVIKNMRDEIIRLGGEIHYNTKLTFENGLAKLAHTGEGGRMISAPTGDGAQCIAPTDEGAQCIAPTIMKGAPIILAIGNSSRDTFRELIENGFDVKAKPIAIGYRIAHRQFLIDKAQYGVSNIVSDDLKYVVSEDLQMKFTTTNDGVKELASTEDSDKTQRNIGKILGPATYKLTYDVGNGHSVYSFCMCPGGYIINSSNYKGMLSINGMSYNDRNGKYANSAIIETITPEDVVQTVSDDGRMISAHEGMCQKCEKNNEVRPHYSTNASLKMIEFQEQVERAAFELEKGFIPYATSNGCDICSEEVFKGKAKYSEKLKSVYENLGLSFDINKDIEEALKHFNKIINGFYDDYIIAGVETRTSSPVKLDRDEKYMCNVPNFYPCGEGLGHGGGIMSCAVDGINVALAIIKNQNSDE